MTEETAVTLPGYEHVYSGKVRDLYAPIDPATGAADPTRLLLVASDRISAYDWVLDSEIPDKGAILTQLSLWWFERLADLVPNHVVSTDVPEAVAGRAVLVRRLEMVPVEAIGHPTEDTPIYISVITASFDAVAATGSIVFEPVTRAYRDDLDA